MYRCPDCGLEFETPVRVRECIGEFWGAPAYEEYSTCPRCECEHYEEIKDDDEDEEEEEEED